jgi:4-carboxymuconolactone decarboxylase
MEHFSSQDAQIISYVQELLRSRRASEATFQALYARLGERGLVELTATVGYYVMLACVLNGFDVVTTEPPEDLRI